MRARLRRALALLFTLDGLIRALVVIILRPRLTLRLSEVATPPLNSRRRPWRAPDGASSHQIRSSFKTRAVFAIASGDTRSSAKACSAPNARAKQPLLAEQSRRQLGLLQRRHGVGQTYGL